MQHLKILFCAFLTLIGCRSTSIERASITTDADTIENSKMKIIDIHTHYRYSRDYFPDFFGKNKMQAVLVDIATADSIGTKRSWDTYAKNAEVYPETFLLCSALVGVGIDNPDFATINIARLQREITSGARMVKVWKNFGMVTKDGSGKYIQIDDPRLQPIWDFLKEKGVPVLAHIGEPRQAWQPLENPKNPHYSYYKEHPEYHAYKLPEIPSYETIIGARDRWIANNPNLEILCAHFGSMSHDVDMIAERLDKFPNMYVETAARFGDLVGQDSKKVSAFFDKYQDRILFGTDFGNDTSEGSITANDMKREQKELEASYQTLWKYLGTADSVEIRGRRNVGLNLPEPVLQKIYYQNAARLLKL